MSVNIDTFGNKIDAQMDAIPHAGYAYYIMTKNSKPGIHPRWSSRGGSQGWASYFGNPLKNSAPWFVPMTVDTKLEIVSMSKTITAAAILKAVAKAHANKVDELANGLDSLIHPLLPPSWGVGASPFFKKLTIRHLLEHRSGLTVAASAKGLAESLWENMLFAIQTTPTTSPDNLPYSYQNVNYGILRVVLAYIVHTPQSMNLILKITDSENFQLSVGATYVTYARDNILAPAGIKDADIDDPTSLARYYLGDDMSVPAVSNYAFLYGANAVTKNGTPNALLACGGALWKLSAKEYCQFVAALSHNGLGLDASTWANEIKNPKHYIGLNPGIQFGVLGEYFGKPGELVVPTQTGELGVPRGVEAAWLWFPPAPMLDNSRAIVAVLLINSCRSNKNALGMHPQKILGFAHDLAVLDGIATQ